MAPTREFKDLSFPLQQTLSGFADQLKTELGDNLLALTMFGSALNADFDSNDDAIRTVITLPKIDLGFLRQLAHRAAILAESGFTAPVVMTPDYVSQSLDALPLELLEIHLRNLTIHGEDLFCGLTFSSAHLRLQCERELKLQLRAMRQGLLLTAGREEMLSGLEVHTAESLLRTMRGMLWIRGTKHYVDSWQVISLTEKLIGRDLEGVRFALSSAVDHGWDQFVALYNDLEVLCDAVDNW